MNRMQHDTYSSLHELLHGVVGATDTEKEAKEALWRAMQSEKDDFFRLLFDNWFIRNWRTYQPVQGKDGRIELVRQRAETRKQEVRTILHQSSGIILMMLPLPDGTLLRDANQAKLKKAGGWFVRLSKHVTGKKTVAECVTEKQLHAAWSGS